MYTVDYFIKKFEAIPEERWCVERAQNDQGQRCAWGHIKYDESRPLGDNGVLRAFQTLLKSSGLNLNGDPSNINNGIDERYQQPTPKQRILAALYDIKKMQSKDIDTGGKVKEVIRYVAVPATLTEQAKELITN